MAKELHISISPCPNDTFAFHAMLNGLVDTEGVRYSADFHDIDVLNRLAAEDSSQQIIKVSYAVIPSLISNYSLLSAGSALGYGNGPVVVSRRKIYPDELHDASIAIPGEGTTAARLLAVLYPEAVKQKVYLFSDIADAVADGEVDAGVLIHEGRFTFGDKGLRLVADLGRQWEEKFGMPIPLGGILVNKSVDAEDARKTVRAIRRSIEFAFANPEASADFVKCHAQELSDTVRQKHISYFVNDFSLDLGEKGIGAISMLLGKEEVEKIDFITP